MNLEWCDNKALKSTQEEVQPNMFRLNALREREFFIDNLLVRIHFIIVMGRWTGLAPWEFELPLSPRSTGAEHHFRAKKGYLKG